MFGREIAVLMLPVLLIDSVVSIKGHSVIKKAIIP